MSYLSSIKEGITIVNKNWQLVLIQLAFILFSFISFFLVVGIPIAIAFILFGLDFTEILRLKDVLSIFQGSIELLKRYFGMAVLVIMSFIFYLTTIVILWVFTLAGTMGLLATTIQDATQQFTMRRFLHEGRRFFLHLFTFLLVIGIIFISLAIILSVIGSGVSTVIEIAETQEATLALFFGVFFSLVLFSLGLFLILSTLSIAVYGMAYMSFHKSRTWETLIETLKYLYARPASIGLYGTLFLGYGLIGFLVILMGSPLALIPILGALLSLPYQLIMYIIQGYVGLITLAAIFYYFFKTGLPQPLPGQSFVTPEKTWSNEGSHISEDLTGAQPPVPEQRD